MPTRWRWLVAGVVVLALAGAGFWWFAVRDDAPPPASLPDVTTPSVAATSAAGTEATATTAPVPTAAPTLDGTWVVQPDPLVWAGYRMQEQWVNQTVEHTVVGRTAVVGGAVEFTGPYLARASFEVGLTQLQSGWDERDGQMQIVLDTAQFPTATLTTLEPVRIPAVVTVATTVAVDVPAVLTIKGVSQPVSLSVQGRWNGGSVDVAGSTEIGLADFGIDPGSAGGLVTVGDQATVEFVVRMVRG